MKGPVTRQKVGLGFSQFRENWCPTCKETFQTELLQPRPLSCRFCGSDMPAKPASLLDIAPPKKKWSRPIKPGPLS